jgi:hypothetical protein
MVHATNPRVTSSARGLAVTYGMGLVLWPLFATILATAVLNEHSSLADCAVFFLRSCFAVGAFVWAHRTAASPRSTSTISFVAIPTLFWFVYAIAGIMQYLGVLDTNVFWAYHDPANQRNVTTGFMAMDAPQISVWATFGAAWALWLSETAKGWLRWLLLCMPSTSIILCICVASRYGLVGSCLATLLTSAVVIRGRSGMTRLAFAAVVIAALIPFASQYWDVLPLEQKQHIETKFAILAAIRSPSEALDARDSSTQFLIQYISSNPLRLVVGSGIATECDAGCEVRTYAEGDFIRVLWAGGLVALLSYLAILAMLVRRAITTMHSTTRKCVKHTPALLLVSTFLCLVYSVGQFNLFTNFEFNMPIYYVLWLVIGALYAGGGDAPLTQCKPVAARQRSARLTQSQRPLLIGPLC